MLSIYESVNYKRVRLPEEFRALNRIIPKISHIKMEVRREAQLQDTRIYSAFDEIDFELYNTGWKDRHDPNG